MMTLPFAIISVGQLQLQGRVGRLLAFPDISYGLYLYGFPVEQAVSAAFHGHVDPQIDFAVALLLTSALALVSWHLVEKTALRLKPRRAFLGVKSA
jgi:peptidoglycan/LPS O-acetylase OafA/YrhL